MEFTLADVIGYILTFVAGGLVGGTVQKNRMKVKQTQQQNGNFAGGDIIGGNKNDK